MIPNKSQKEDRKRQKEIRLERITKATKNFQVYISIEIREIFVAKLCYCIKMNGRRASCTRMQTDGSGLRNHDGRGFSQLLAAAAHPPRNAPKP